MEPDQIRTDYSLLKEHFVNLQEEVALRLNQLIETRKGDFDALPLGQGRKTGVKSLESILGNVSQRGRYSNKIKRLPDIPDIAALRVTVYCEDDVENFTRAVSDDLSSDYDVSIKPLGGPTDPRQPYRATHVYITKSVDTKNGEERLTCEIQVRTVTANAWAELNRKYNYKPRLEGEVDDLSRAVSAIMGGCENIWTLVKKKCAGVEQVDVPESVHKITQEVTESAEDTTWSVQTRVVDNELWLQAHVREAHKILTTAGIKTFMEVIVTPKTQVGFSGTSLMNAAEQSTIRTFGWPIGVFLSNRDQLRPMPDESGITAKVLIDEASSVVGSGTRLDYWSISHGGAFYLAKSLFEKERAPDQIFFNTRVVRIAEVFLYLKNLYTQLGVQNDFRFDVTVRHEGISGKTLGSSNPSRLLLERPASGQNVVEVPVVNVSIGDIEKDLVRLVKANTDKLFEAFNLFELSDDVLSDIVQKYLEGKVT